MSEPVEDDILLYEWSVRCLRAERERDEARAKVKQLEEQLRYANGTWDVGKDGQPL